MEPMTEFNDSPGAGDSKPPIAGGTEPDALQVDPARAALVEEWQKKIKDAKKHWGPAFKRMDECVQLAAVGADKEWAESGKYTVAVVNRHINVTVSQLYARDPRAVAKRKKKLLFKLWDGDPKTYQMALQSTMPPPNAVALPGPTGLIPFVPGPGGMPAPWQPDPNAQAIVAEVQTALAENQLVERLGKALELLWNYFIGEQSNGFKQSAKAAVRRTKVRGVSYIKLMFQRELVQNPDDSVKINDMSQQLQVIEARQKQLADGDIDPEDAKAEELRGLLAKLQQNPYVVGREGPLFAFPASKSIIIDPKVTHLKTLTGADWLAEEFEFTPEEVLEKYKIDVRGRFTEHKITKDKKDSGSGEAKAYARVYEVQHKKNCETFTICEGYPDFLKEPGEPDVKIERFWTIFPIVFNEAEGDEWIFPPSDVWLLRHSQMEMNRSREGLRQHRIHSQPKYATHRGALDKTDKEALKSAAAHEVVELKVLKPGQDVDSVLQSIKPAGIDPNVYDVAQNLQDIERTVGTQQANLGGTSKGSATESSIAEQSRSVSTSDNVDDLDDVLTELARAFSQLCLMELSAQTVQEICGPGAPWPQLQGKREEIAKDLYLDIKAGSSGRPNAAMELANFERILPYVIQIPGVPPKSILEKLYSLVDMDIEEAYIEGLPSIQATNLLLTKMQQGAQPSTGDPATDPNAQGAEGGDKRPNPQQNEPGGQPAYPAPAPA